MQKTGSYNTGLFLIIILMFFFLCSYIPSSNVKSLHSSASETITIQTDSDAYINSTTPDTTSGIYEILEIGQINTRQSVAFLRFNLPWFLTGAVILSASMEITALPSWLSFNDSLLIGAFSCWDTSWSERDLTWNTAPWSAVSNQIQDIQRSSNSTNSCEFDVTSATQRASPTGQVTIVLRAKENGSKLFWAHENQDIYDRPAQLDIHYIPAGSTDAINVGLEYGSGFLPQLSLWFSWINTGITQVIFVIAGYPEGDHFYPGTSFVGQHFYTENDTEVFVGHSVLVYELFNDTNGNGILDANFSNGVVETAYYLSLNMSMGFIPRPVEKVLVDETWHYQWGVHFGDVVGFLNYPNGSALIGGESAGILELEYLEMRYDYYLVGNTSFLKTSLSIGEVAFFNPIIPEASFYNFSLAALHSTVLLTSSRQSEILIGSEGYNSSLPNQPTLPITNASIQDFNTRFYQLLFNSTYMLFSPSPLQLPVNTSACPSVSLHPHVPQRYLELPINLLQGFLLTFLPRITQTPPTITLDYRESGLLYRVNYPQWDGFALEHDPTYIANVSPAHPFTPPSPFSPWLITIYAVAIFGSIVLIATVLELRRVRKITDEKG